MKDEHSPLSISLIGAGSLGQSLARLWQSQNDLSIQQVFTQGMPSAQRAVDFIGGGRPHTILSELVPPDVLLIAVPDDQISLVCATLHSQQHTLHNTVVFHCSGVMSSQELTPLKQLGASVASIHPIKSFANPEDVIVSFQDTFCGVEGDDAALKILNPLFHAIGGSCIPINADSKALYHCAAVFANNYMVSLIESAQTLYQLSGIERSLSMQLMAPMLRETCNNVINLGTQHSLTGPIARGDIKTLEKHLSALEDTNKETIELYKSLGKVALQLKTKDNKSRVDHEIQKLLSDKK